MGCEASNASEPEAKPGSASEPEAKPGDGQHAAFMFIKPHAVNEAVRASVTKQLNDAGVSIVAEGEIDAATIDKQHYIDTHYGAIANRAVRSQPSELNVPPAAQTKFEEAFGLKWPQALESGLVLNATDSAARLGVDANGLETAWRLLEKDNLTVKFGGGFYCGRLKDGSGVDFYSINAFYLNMRAVYTTPPAAVYYYSVQWKASALSWAHFRSKVLGATNPVDAEAGSIRRSIFDNWQSLGLSSEPNKGENGVHGSASPMEGLFERMNWLQQEVLSDIYGKQLTGAGISSETIKTWSGDPAVEFEGAKNSLFDLLEDLDLEACTTKAIAINKA